MLWLIIGPPYPGYKKIQKLKKEEKKRGLVTFCLKSSVRFLS